MSSKAVREQEKQEAIERLRDILKPGDTVYTILKHKSRSGMQRKIDLYAIKPNCNGVHEPRYLSGYAARALGWRLSDGRGIVVDGCGMDMGFHVVYELSGVLFGKSSDLRQEWM